MTMPKPGKPVRGSQTGHPIMALLDLLGRRWVLRIVWELREENLGFRELQARCDGMSPSVLSQRLAEIKAADMVQIDAEGRYGLSEEGKKLLESLMPLQDWAKRWAEREGKANPN